MFVMKTKSILATLLLLVAGLQTAWGQGFRVYKSDGTVAQFSLRTDSIVFYDGIGTDEDFGPFTPVNDLVVGKWYKTKYEWITLNPDGTTSGWDNAWGQGEHGDFTYRFFPYQGNLVVYSATGKALYCLRVVDFSSDRLVVDNSGRMDAQYSSLFELTRTQPPLLVFSIILSNTQMRLEVGRTAQLTATVEPLDADNTQVSWESSNTSVAVVDDNGLVTALGEGYCEIFCRATDGSDVWAICSLTVEAGTTPDPGNHEWVDLGLPSGTLWATCNVGANSPEEYGDYFAWGETTTKSDYYWNTYFDTDDDGSTFKKYNNNGGLTELQPADDAATANWGSAWQMPSLEQMQELINSEYTTSEQTTQNGVNGRRITSNSNGNCIFLPSAGIFSGMDLNGAGSRGIYWSRSLHASNTSNAYYLGFDFRSFITDYSYRFSGLSVRPVRVN